MTISVALTPRRSFPHGAVAMSCFRKVLVVALPFVFLSCLGAADPSPEEGLLTKVLKAAGGEANLAKVANVSLKGKGTFIEEDSNTPYTLEWVQGGADRERSVSVVGEGDDKKRIVSVVTAKGGWIKENDDETRDLTDEELKNERETLHLGWVTNLSPLKGKEYRLGMASAIKVNDKEAVGLKVMREGFADLTLYFDKESNLLVKTERRCAHPDSGETVLEEAFYENYKEVQGVQYPSKTSLKYDGKDYSKLEITDISFPEKLDDKSFEKP
jgi:hypothetical protein